MNIIRVMLISLLVIIRYYSYIYNLQIMINENPLLYSEHKRQALYHQIRRKQIQFSFKLLRRRDQEIPKSEASILVNHNFKELKANPHPTRKAELIKELKDIILNQYIPDAINNYSNISLILNMQDDPKLDDIVLQFVHQILAEISSFRQSPLKLKDIPNFEYLGGRKVQVINTLLVIIGNLIIKDSNFESLRFLIKEKSVFKKLMKLIEPSFMYDHIQQNLLWTSTILVYTTNQYQLQTLDEGYFQNLLLQLYNTTKNKILGWGQVNLEELRVKNLDQLYHRLTIVTKIYQFKQDYQLFKKLQELGEIQNMRYATLLRTLLYYYDYQLPQKLLLSVLNNITEHTNQQLVKVYFNILMNSMENNRSLWKLILNQFIKAVPFMENTSYKQQYPFTGLFIYFFDIQPLKITVFELMKRIWTFQGGIGCFQECLLTVAQAQQNQIYDYLLQNNFIQ